MTRADASIPASSRVSGAAPLRPVPPPTHLSADAQRALDREGEAPAAFPSPADAPAWKRLAGLLDAQFNAALGPALRGQLNRVSRTAFRGVPGYTCQPPDVAHSGRICLSVHGGAFLGGGGELVAFDALRSSRVTGLQTFSVDYRMPPDHPYPAAVDDVLAAYEYLLASWRSEDIIVSGISAGGNIAASAMLRARDADLPLPAGVVLASPEVDLTESGDSFSTLMGLDPVLPVRLQPVNELYASTASLTDPYVSPLFADFSKGFPRAFLQAGTRDLFLSNAVRMHRALRKGGCEAELHVWDGMPHGGFGGLTPEDDDVALEIKRFVASCLAN